jgi:hypothetical protein
MFDFKDIRKSISKVLTILMVLNSALFFWHVCMLYLNNDTPIVVVLSGRDLK